MCQERIYLPKRFIFVRWLPGGGGITKTRINFQDLWKTLHCQVQFPFFCKRMPQSQIGSGFIREFCNSIIPNRHRITPHNVSLISPERKNENHKQTSAIGLKSGSQSTIWIFGFFQFVFTESTSFLPEIACLTLK